MRVDREGARSRLRPVLRALAHAAQQQRDAARRRQRPQPQPLHEGRHATRAASQRRARARGRRRLRLALQRRFWLGLGLGLREHEQHSSCRRSSRRRRRRSRLELAALRRQTRALRDSADRALRRSSNALSYAHTSTCVLVLVPERVPLSGNVHESLSQSSPPVHTVHEQVVGRVDGSVTLYELRFPPVHCLFRERYAYRDQLSDVVVCHLLANQRGYLPSSLFSFLLLLLYSLSFVLSLSRFYL